VLHDRDHLLFDLLRRLFGEVDFPLQSEQLAIVSHPILAHSTVADLAAFGFQPGVHVSPLRFERFVLGRKSSDGGAFPRQLGFELVGIAYQLTHLLHLLFELTVQLLECCESINIAF
jgi:hypothetical protein